MQRPKFPAIWTGTVTVGNGPESSGRDRLFGLCRRCGGNHDAKVASNWMVLPTRSKSWPRHSQTPAFTRPRSARHKELSTPFILHGIGMQLSFESTDASTRDGANSYIYTWSDPNLSWSEGDSLHVATDHWRLPQT